MANFETYPRLQPSDPMVPSDGEQNITGDLAVAGSITVLDGESVAGSVGNNSLTFNSGSDQEVRLSADNGISLHVNVSDVLVEDGLVTINGPLSIDSAITSTLATGAAPFVVASTTAVANLAITSAGLPDPYVPVDGTMNVTGALAVSALATFGGNVTLSNGDLQIPASNVAKINIFRSLNSGTSIVFQEQSGNTLATFYDDGTTGSMQLTGTKSRGAVTMNADNVTAATVTVNAGGIAVVSCESAVAATPAYSISGTTLTITNSVAIGGKVVNYICL